VDVPARTSTHAPSVDASAYDARIYLVVRPPVNERHLAVEGESEQDGRIGTSTSSSTRTWWDFALFVVAHELFHTLGASDKYDAEAARSCPTGSRSRICRHAFLSDALRSWRAIASSRRADERVPETLDELGVGPATAREIGWMR
jgi:hypothetical protein